MTETILNKINEILKKSDFETLFLDEYSNKKSKFCFDLLVKKEDSIFSVKLISNIDNISPEIINDIKSLSLLLKSKPLLIGIRNRYQKLEDNTIYIREGLPFITLNTLENILNRNVYPYILAKRGGGVVFLNGTLMKEFREQHLISRKELSEKLGIAKRTVYSYENESLRPSEKIAEKISDILESNDIFKRINVFDWPIKYDLDKRENSEESDLSPFESHIQEIINDIGICTYWYKKGPIPFQLSIYSQISKSIQESNFYPIFSGITEDQKKINESIVKCLRSFTKLFHKNALFIINDNIKITDTLMKEKIPFVKVKDLEEIDDEEEFIELIQEL
ncbi:MAG: helix-turn-helix domain-containing protein [Candidatus Heimdallarchaeota archaeon]